MDDFRLALFSAHERSDFRCHDTLGSWLLDLENRSVETLSDQNRGARNTDTNTFKLSLKEGCPRCNNINLVQSQSIDPFFLVVSGWCAQQHWSIEQTRIAEDDMEAVWPSSFLFICVFQDEVVQWFEVLRHKVFLVLHLTDFKVDQTSIRKNNETLLPTSKEAGRFLGECANFTDAGEEVAHNLFCEVWITLYDFLLQALVSHQKFLLIELCSSRHNVSKGVIISNLIIVDLHVATHLIESAKGSKIMVDTSLFLGIPFVLFASLFFLKAPLNFFIDEECLSSCCCYKLDVLIIEVFLVLLKLLFLKFELRALSMN